MALDLTRADLVADLVVVGAGVAGLTAALRAAELGLRVVICNKGAAYSPESRAHAGPVEHAGPAQHGAPVEHSTSTYYAQGGVAVVAPDSADDSVDLHLHDTLVAGAGLGDPEISREILADGWSAVSRLLGWGAQFDRDASGRLTRTREGGHSVRRIIHAGGDATGAQIQQALSAAVATVIRRGDVRVLDDCTVTHVLTTNERAVGVAYLGADGPGVVHAPTVLLATGGSGHLFAATTNPAGATADGLALALRAGADVADLEFVQFHPTMLYTPGARGRRTLVTEAIRGEGGRLVDVDGKSVTEGVHPLGDLAPRDVVANAVTAAMERTGHPCVYLDISAIDDFVTRFPTVNAGLRAAGLDPADGRIPVVPGAHYQCGGVVTDAHGRTSVAGLLAAGEVARTGLHGANRLASNSLLEGLVVGVRAADVAALARADGAVDTTSFGDVDAGVEHVVDREALQNAMSRFVGLRRNAEGLGRVAALLDDASPRVVATQRDVEDAALTLAARAVVTAALARTSSRGCHVRTDEQCPATDLHGTGEQSSPRFRLIDGDVCAVGVEVPALTSVD
ncbi:MULTISPECIES: L-aspartate oxidase [Gordonia]|uniref:L-aspartate oxidase n=1 Tax=Gordonia sputi NBRC 100414 TaxID=1089453 RepID=H5TWX8_9ACTN|nr:MULTISPECIES: L-aspartate oxidase [Gordonia]MCM3894451.1 L-aspartate oxidase [Gordonia sputi]NKY94851.1 L-aspartate oxidase [Gordonia sputi]OBA32421.1 L-aspartate oxidase [Gordonia sp. 852002-51296_SCH5728562-b]OBA74448.1 L-aspartate oxidase [Gordonia sp. 852002-10350_SCH5691597]GAB37986.1 L-aspartate oxidase [Gordonia sputi NBRC 100414]